MKDESLIHWCKEFLTPNAVMINIGAGSGSYPLLLHSYCQTIHAFETNELITLHQNMMNNHIHNVKLYTLNYPIDQLNLTDVKLITCYHDDMNIINHILKTLNINNYPPILFTKNMAISALLFNLGYQIHLINNYPDVLLASDHAQFDVDHDDHHDQHLQQCDDIVLSFVDEQKRDTAMNQLYHYMVKLPVIKTIYLNCPMPKTRVPNNPSIIYDDVNKTYLCNIRYSNYVYDPHFRFLDEHNIHVSDHVLMTLDQDFCIQNTKQIVDKTNNVYYDSFVYGIDDLRLINKTQFICSHGNFNQNRLIEQCLGTLDEHGHVIKLIPLIGPVKGRHEKNWLPFYQHDKLYVIYMIHPFMLYEVNQTNGNLIQVKNTFLSDKNCSGFRGGSPPIKYKSGWLSLIHQVTKNLCYFHRFIWFDENFTTMKLSLPFYFETKGIEFSLGMCYDGSHIIITHSVWDNHARIIVIDEDIINDYLKLKND
ncbi:MAG TPA: hypothetical protein VLG50_07890 [Candidatus Saccharimonadales bacterium]|nr:hypothetical protein [Candidatus Saccharimonadales bacterium]